MLQTSNSSEVLQSEKRRSRLTFADYLRGWALVVMIETHVFNALLTPELRQTAWFSVLNFVNGLVAPSFLFVSGFVFVVAAQRTLESFRAFQKPLWGQLRKIALVWLIGYGLHFPQAFFTTSVAQFDAQDWMGFYRVDILHCICVTWLFLLLSVLAIRSDRLQRYWLFASALAMIFLAPLAWRIDFSQYLPLPLAAYLNGKHGSLFPIFPWSGFMVAGALCSSLYLSARQNNREQLAINWLTVAGAVLLGVGWFSPSLTGPEVSWTADPRAVLLRLGIVLLLLRACWQYGRRYPATRDTALLIVSHESLFVYVGHLVVIYAPVLAGRSLSQFLGQSFGPMLCFAASLVLITLMIIAARIWTQRSYLAFNICWTPTT